MSKRIVILILVLGTLITAAIIIFHESPKLFEVAPSPIHTHLSETLQTREIKPTLTLSNLPQLPTLTPWPTPITSSKTAYLPGVGFVENPANSLFLSKPASLKKNGVTLTVEQGVSDGTQTVIIYRASGLSVRAANSQGEGASGIGSIARLRLPDGTEVKQIGGEGRGWGTGYRTLLIFPLLPEGFDQATFIIPRLQDMPPGAAPEGWEISLVFAERSNRVKMEPVYDLETDQASRVSTDNIDFQLERVAQQEDGFLFEGNLSWKEDDIQQVYAGGLIITDASGQKIPTVWDHHSGSQAVEQEKRLGWAFRTQGTTFNGPLTLNFQEVIVDMKVNLSFQFDPGPQPQIGQIWNPNQKFTVAGHSIQIAAVKIIPVPLGQGIEIDIKGDPDISFVAVGLDDSAHPADSITSSTSESIEGITQVFNYIHGLPPGPYKIQINQVSYRRRGPWQVSWNPPGSQLRPAPAAISQPCLTLDQWRQLEKQANVPLPAGLGGKLLLYGKLDASGKYGNILSSLDGKDTRVLGGQLWARLSMDGSRLVYDWNNGLAIKDISSGRTLPVPGTEGTAVYNPIWSPDGNWIAFNRLVEDNDIFIIRPDGSDLEQVTRTLDNEELSGWTPDGLGLVFTAYTPEGEKWIRSVNIKTGQVDNLFPLNKLGREGTGPFLSPDGKQMVYSAGVFGQNALGLYLSEMNGTHPQLFATLDFLSMGVDAWSPDGKWLAVNVHENTRDGVIETPVLIQPETCQVVPLKNLNGTIASWISVK